MMLTEHDAKGKWCPHSMAQPPHVAGTPKPASNRPEGSTNCLGSACMCWVWGPPPPASNTSPKGFCGMAGG